MLFLFFKTAFNLCANYIQVVFGSQNIEFLSCLMVLDVWHKSLKWANCKPSFSINDPLVTYATSAFRPLICKTSLLLILFCSSKPRLFPLVTLISKEVITYYQDLSWFRFRQIRFRQNCPQTVLLESLGQISLLPLHLFLVRVHFAAEILPHLL